MDYQLLTILAQGGDCSGEGAYWHAKLEPDFSWIPEADREIHQDSGDDRHPPPPTSALMLLTTLVSSLE